MFWALAALFTARVLFWILNNGIFRISSISDFFTVFFWGSYFDLITLFYFLLPFTIFSFLPFSIYYKKNYQTALKIFFIIVLSLLFTITIADAAYFPFSKTRLGIEAFKMAASEEISIFKYVADYWYFLPVIAFVVFSVIRFYPKLNNSNKNKWYFELPINLFLLILFAITIRGGFRLKPLRSIDTSLFVASQYSQLAISSGFNLIESYTSETIEIKNYFTSEKLDTIMTSDYISFYDNGSKNKNIFIIILESFGKEYTFPEVHSINSFSPFLHELALKSELYTKAFSNGTRSVDAIPAILEGVPKLTKSDFMYSNYITNTTPGFAYYLKGLGYSCNFYHGGSNGTLGFEAFLKSRGWNYYGKNQYKGDKNDYDGNWGIYDGKYFKYVKSEISNTRNPFVTVVFTLSSHHPYKLPPDYNDSFKNIKKPIHKTVKYVDNCLRDFFKSIENEKWFYNTVFIITADHSAENFTKYYQSNTGKFEVPLLVYEPAKLKCDTIRTLIQHIDILPLALSKAGFSGKIFSLGNYFKDNSLKISFHNEEGIYTAFTDSVYMTYDGKKSKFFNIYNKQKPKKETQTQLEFSMKAIIQDFNYRIINNKFY